MSAKIGFGAFALSFLASKNFGTSDLGTAMIVGVTSSMAAEAAGRLLHNGLVEAHESMKKLVGESLYPVAYYKKQTGKLAAAAVVGLGVHFGMQAWINRHTPTPLNTTASELASPINSALITNAPKP